MTRGCFAWNVHQDVDARAASINRTLGHKIDHGNNPGRAVGSSATFCGNSRALVLQSLDDLRISIPIHIERSAQVRCAERSVMRLLSLCLLLTVAACSTPPLHLNRDVPSTFESQTPAAAPLAHWYREFGSDELVRLIELAGNNNLDLAAAQARVWQADARARAAGAAILPQLDVGPNATRFSGRSHADTAHETDWSALLSATYEVDFWGKNAAAGNAAHFAALASEADRATVALTVQSGVATGYFQVLSLRERLSLARANLDSAREMLAAIQARFDAGAAAPTELASQRAAVATAELTLPDLEQQEMAARAALALLVGQVPEGFVVAADQLDGLSEPRVTAGLPSELLTRRPDVLAAEANLRAAHADVAAARAALFPSLTLTASGGVQNPAVQAAVITLEGTGPALIVGAALTQTVFDGGRRRAGRDEAQAHEAELVATYRTAILNALVDVETALSAIRYLDAQRASQAENVTQSERAVAGARLRYRAGSGDFLSLLDAQRTWYAAREQMSQYRLARLQAIVSLCKALGGGWESPSLANPATAEQQSTP